VASHRLTRRGVLAGVTGLAVTGLGGCAVFTPAQLPDPSASRASAASLRIVLFEVEALNLPFHTGLIIRTPEGVTIYDPSARRDPGEGCYRDGDLIRSVGPAAEAAYLARAGLPGVPGGWTVHVFERAVSPELARLALDRAEAAQRMPPLHCTFGVTTLLASLPGFDFVSPQPVTGAFLRSLLLREEFTYTRLEAPGAQAG